MKKIFKFVLVMALGLILFACGNNANEEVVNKLVIEDSLLVKNPPVPVIELLPIIYVLQAIVVDNEVINCILNLFLYFQYHYLIFNVFCKSTSIRS